MVALANPMVIIILQCAKCIHTLYTLHLCNVICQFYLRITRKEIMVDKHLDGVF